MATYINIKTRKPQLCGRAPLLMNEKHTNASKANRYYKYQLLFNYHYPNLNNKPVVSAVQQTPIAIEHVLKQSKIKWLEITQHWIVELFTRDKSNQEILSGTA